MSRSKVIVRAASAALLITGLTTGIWPGAASAASGVNGMQNGSFEDPPIPSVPNNGTWTNLSTIPGWNPTNGCGIELQENGDTNPASTAADGTQWAELASNCPSGIYQDVPTIPGWTYSLSYAYSAREGIASNDMTVSWNGAVERAVSADGTGQALPVWTTYNDVVTATAATTRVQFDDVSANGSEGDLLDAVSLTPDLTLCLLYDQAKSHQPGSTVPIKVELCDANSSNISTPDVTLHAASLTKMSSTSSSDVEDSGNANPSNDFRYEATLDGYIYNLSTKGLDSGTYVVTVTVNNGAGGSFTLPFGIR